MTPILNDEHYSYSIYANPDIAGQFDQSRFGGPIGELVMMGQERVITSFAGDVRDLQVLDVGTGTGRAALAIARRGAKVTGVDASIEMLKVAKEYAAHANLEVEFLQGDAHSLNFPDQSFDIVVSLRMLMHTPHWQSCLMELCRVSRRRVIFDYPPLISISTFQAMARRVRSVIDRNAEAYHTIKTSEVYRVLKDNGFQVADINRQFVLPIAFHKLIGSRRFTITVEKTLSDLGVLSIIGAPVTILAERNSS